MAAAETRRGDETDATKRIYPGGAFDPLNFAKGDIESLKLKEIKNGRLAMMACLGFVAQHAATGKTPLQALGDHISNPWANNVSGGDECIWGGVQRRGVAWLWGDHVSNPWANTVSGECLCGRGDKCFLGAGVWSECITGSVQGACAWVGRGSQNDCVNEKLCIFCWQCTWVLLSCMLPTRSSGQEKPVSLHCCAVHLPYRCCAAPLSVAVAVVQFATNGVSLPF
jgi:hypothetical protein